MGADALGPECAILSLEASPLEGMAQGQQQLLDRERLLDEVECAELGRSHGRLDGAVTAHHHDGKLRPAAAQLREDLHAVAAGHGDVEQDHLRGGLLPQGRERPLSVLGERDVEAFVGEDAGQGSADPCLVIDDQDATHVLPRTLPARRCSRAAR